MVVVAMRMVIYQAFVPIVYHPFAMTRINTQVLLAHPPLSAKTDETITAVHTWERK